MRALLALSALLALAAIPTARQTPPDDSGYEEMIRAADDQILVQQEAWFDNGLFLPIINVLRMQAHANPHSYQLNTDLGFMLFSTEQYEEELSVYVRFRDNNPSDPDAVWPEANFYFQKRIYAEVPPLLEPSIKGEPWPHPNSFRLLAHAYERLGMVSDAERVWLRYIELVPTDEAAKNNLRRVQSKLHS